MSLANEDRGGLVGAFIVVEGDEVLSITANGQVVRSPINDQISGPPGAPRWGIKFVTPKAGDSVAVVARSVEKVADEDEPAVGCLRWPKGRMQRSRSDSAETEPKPSPNHRRTDERSQGRRGVDRAWRTFGIG